MVKRIKIYEDCRFITDDQALERAMSVFDKTICLKSRSIKVNFSKIAVKVGKTSSPTGNRTPVSGVRGQRPNR